MKLLFRQRVFSWLDSYDVYDENGNKVYEVKGQIAWGHCQKIFDNNGKELGKIQEQKIAITPTFTVSTGGKKIGQIKRKMVSFLRPSYDINYNGWKLDGNITEWNYKIKDSNNNIIATIRKELLNLTDTYSLDIVNPNDALSVLMFVIAIDAEKSSRK